MANMNIALGDLWDRRTKKIEIFYDGQEIGSVYRGEIRSFDITGGYHKLKVKSGWFMSRELIFSLPENGTYNFNITLFKYGNLILSLAWGLMSLHFIATLFFNITFIIWLAMPVFLISLYYMSWGRKDYLVIKEMNV